MFEFRNQVVYRDGYKFVGEQKGNIFIYKTSDKKEIEVLERNGYKNKVVKSISNKKENESNKKGNKKMGV